jgi:hypothetical protein
MQRDRICRAAVMPGAGANHNRVLQPLNSIKPTAT